MGSAKGALRQVLVGALLAAAAPTFANAEIAVLSHGRTLRVAGHSTQGEEVRLDFAGGGEVLVPASLVVGFVPDEVVEEIAKAGGDADVDTLVRTVAERHGLDPALLRAIVGVESAFRPDAVSPKGARGLMQLMPATAAELGVEDSFDPEQNLDGGARYLMQMLDLHDGDITKALAAYNAGPAAVKRHKGVPPYRETSEYVRRVFARWKAERAAGARALSSASTVSEKAAP